jgi:hypothetical protein
MRKRIRERPKAQAILDVEEGGFLCQLCEEEGDSLVYESWEIVKHLKDFHKVNRRDQRIIGWNDEFERVYKKNLHSRIDVNPEHTGEIVLDNTPERNHEKGRKRRLMEYKARREALD